MLLSKISTPALNFFSIDLPAGSTALFEGLQFLASLGYLKELQRWQPQLEERERRQTADEQRRDSAVSVGSCEALRRDTFQKLLLTAAFFSGNVAALLHKSIHRLDSLPSSTPSNEGSNANQKTELHSLLFALIALCVLTGLFFKLPNIPTLIFGVDIIF